MMLTFSSCASTELELKNRIIVEAIGIDYCDIGVRVTVQFLNADQSSNPNNGGTPDDIVKNMTIDSQKYILRNSEYFKDARQAPHDVSEPCYYFRK